MEACTFRWRMHWLPLSPQRGPRFVGLMRHALEALQQTIVKTTAGKKTHGFVWGFGLPQSWWRSQRNTSTSASSSAANRLTPASRQQKSSLVKLLQALLFCGGVPSPEVSPFLLTGAVLVRPSLSESGSHRGRLRSPAIRFKNQGSCRAKKHDTRSWRRAAVSFSVRAPFGLGATITFKLPHHCHLGMRQIKTAGQ